MSTTGALRFLNALPEAITETDLAGRIRFASDRTARLHGYACPDEMIGLDAFVLIAPEDRAKAQANIAATLEHGGLHSARLTLVRADGTNFPGELSATVLRDAEGSPTGLIAIIRDITERVRNEQQLEESRARAQQSEERYRTISEASMDGIVLVDTEGHIITCNQRFGRMHGVDDVEALIGTNAFNFYADGAREVAKVTFPRLLRERLHARVRRTNQRLDGSTFPSEVSVSVLTDGDGTPIGAVAVSRDISEQQQAEEEIERYQAHLRSLSAKVAIAEDRERRRIGAGLHDGVAQMLVFCGLRLAALDADALSPEVKEVITEVRGELRDSVEQLRSLLFELNSPVLHEFGLAAALRSEVERFQRKWSASFEFSDSTRDVSVDADVNLLLFHAARELLTNAVKHSGATVITTTLSVDDERVVICIQDDGCGFSVKTALSASFGLSHVRERMTHVGGCFEIYSSPGRGTRAVLSAPLDLPTEGQRGPGIDRAPVFQGPS